MRLELDTEAKALYLYIRPGRVADTVNLTPTVFMDVDRDNVPLGLEFLDASDFAPSLAQTPYDVGIPSRLTYTVVDQNRTWEVETGLTGTGPAHMVMNAELTQRFVNEILANPATIETIPQGAVVVLQPLDDPAPLGARRELARHLYRSRA